MADVPSGATRLPNGSWQIPGQPQPVWIREYYCDRQRAVAEGQEAREAAAVIGALGEPDHVGLDKTDLVDAETREPIPAGTEVAAVHDYGEPDALGGQLYGFLYGAELRRLALVGCFCGGFIRRRNVT